MDLECLVDGLQLLGDRLQRAISLLTDTIRLLNGL